LPACLILPALSLAIESGSGAVGPKKGRFSASFITSRSKFDVYEYDNRATSSDNELDEQFLQFSYGLTDYLGASARIGRMGWDPNSPNGGKYDSGSAWGIGVHTSVPLPHPNPDLALRLGWVFSYNRGTPDNRTRNTGDIFKGEIKEWLTAVDLSCAWNRILGYGGIRYSQVDLIYTHDAHDGVRRGGNEEEDPINLFLGARIRILEDLFFRLEWDFVGVSGLNAALTYEFDNPFTPIGDYLRRRWL